MWAQSIVIILKFLFYYSNDMNDIYENIEGYNPN